MVTSTGSSSSTSSSTSDSAGTPDPGSGPTARELRGTPVVSGLAHGPVLPVRTEVSAAAVAAFGDGGLDAEAALAAYVDAAEAVARGFVAKAERATGAAAEVLTASAGLTRDPGLKQAVGQQLGAGEGLPGAVRGAVAQFVEVFTAMGGLMAERATDLLDIERRVIARVVGEPEPGVVLPEEPSVLVAVDLASADTASLDPSVVVALVTERGGPTSHTAIIARQLGLPCVVGCAGVTDLEAGTPVLVDGARGTVATGVDPQEAAHAVAVDREQQARVAGWTGPGVTRDGVPVKLLANVADGPSARSAAESPVQGVGLFRTELCFLDRTEEPSAQEQADIYAQVLEPFAGTGHVVVRTLDAGSDKPVAFATLEDEENPALGVRGLRLALGNPGLLHRQLDGIAEAARRTGAETWVMAPMVANLSEQDMADLAAYFASKKMAPGAVSEELVKQGEQIYRAGNKETGVPACMACHGPNGNGVPAAKWPKLSSQYSTYVEAQLHAFAKGERANDPNSMMRDIASKMSEAEIKAVSAYVFGLK